jgi:hypothetical protein
MPDSPYGHMLRVRSVLVHTVKPAKVHRVSPLQQVRGTRLNKLWLYSSRRRLLGPIGLGGCSTAEGPSRGRRPSAWAKVRKSQPRVISKKDKVKNRTFERRNPKGCAARFKSPVRWRGTKVVRPTGLSYSVERNSTVSAKSQGGTAVSSIRLASLVSRRIGLRVRARFCPFQTECPNSLGPALGSSVAC